MKFFSRKYFKASNYLINQTELTIKRSNAERDNGVYICVADFFITNVSLQSCVLDVVSLLITEKKPLKLRYGDSVNLKCHGYVFGSLFNNLYRVWHKDAQLLNNISFDSEDLTQITERQIDSLDLRNLTYEDSGTYTCKIHDPTNQRYWNTSSQMLRVGDNYIMQLYSSKVLRGVLLTIFSAQALVLIFSLAKLVFKNLC